MSILKSTGTGMNVPITREILSNRGYNVEVNSGAEIEVFFHTREGGSKCDFPLFYAKDNGVLYANLEEKINGVNRPFLLHTVGDLMMIEKYFETSDSNTELWIETRNNVINYLQKNQNMGKVEL